MTLEDLHIRCEDSQRVTSSLTHACEIHPELTDSSEWRWERGWVILRWFALTYCNWVGVVKKINYLDSVFFAPDLHVWDIKYSEEWLRWEIKKKKGTCRAVGPEVTEQEDSYQKQEVKQYLIELGQISTRPKPGSSANVLNGSTLPANTANYVPLAANGRLLSSAVKDSVTF